MAREYVPIFFDWLDVTQDLTAEEKGNLIDAVVAYASGCEYEHLLIGGVRIAFRFLKGQVDRNNKISDSRSEAGKNKPEQTESNDNKPYQNEANRNKRNQTGSNFPKEKEKDKEKENKKEKENDNKSLLTDEEAAGVKSDHERILTAAEDAGFKMSNDVRASLIALYAEHGLEKVLEGFRSCVDHSAVNLAYLRAVLSGKPRPQKAQKKVSAQDYEQRDYADVQRTLENAQRKRIEERLRGQAS